MATEPTQPTQSIPTRRHDLDALRAFAMLLGIALHAALAYTDIPWSARDPAGNPFYWGFFSFIHGFRMPLFFLLSGYFTAMLFERRGLKSLLTHRAKRIALPLLLGLVTIVPVTFATGFAAMAITAPMQTGPPPANTELDIWAAAAAGDTARLATLLDGDADPDQPDPTYGMTPLGWTAATNQPAAAALLLERDADPSARYRDQNTPLHTACFFGRAKVAELLLDAGADQDATSNTGERPADAMRHGPATVSFIAGLFGLELDFEAVTTGREQIAEMLAAHPQRQTDPQTDPQAEPQPAAGLPLKAMLIDFPVFYHLWFLWHLCWLIAGFAVAALVGRVLPNLPKNRPLIITPLALLWLIPLTATLQHAMDSRALFPVMGPDTSAGLIPLPRVLLYNGLFFAFGALLLSRGGIDRRLGRGWWACLPLAAAVYLPTMMLINAAPRAAEAVPDEPARLWLAALGQAIFVWCMIFGMIGLFERAFARPRPWVRFASDSSYWLYLAHLPLIIALQAAFAFTELPHAVKFMLVTAISTGILLLTYRYLIRYTIIGRLLNGKRTRPA